MKKVLCIAPHPDDETLGCGGTLLKHKSNGDEIHWLIMTTIQGSKNFTQEVQDRRDKEILNVVNAYDFDSFYQTNFLTTELDTIPMNQIVDELAKQLNLIKPEIIYIPYSDDIHTDHRVVFDVAISASKIFRHPYIKSIRCYETISETEFNIDPDVEAFKPNILNDITDFIDRKIEIMSIYESEMGAPPFPRSEKNIRALATYRGSLSGSEYAEAFITLRELL